MNFLGQPGREGTPGREGAAGREGTAGREGAVGREGSAGNEGERGRRGRDGGWALFVLTVLVVVALAWIGERHSCQRVAEQRAALHLKPLDCGGLFPDTR